MKLLTSTCCGCSHLPYFSRARDCGADAEAAEGAAAAAAAADGGGADEPAAEEDGRAQAEAGGGEGEANPGPPPAGGESVCETCRDARGGVVHVQDHGL